MVFHYASGRERIDQKILISRSPYTPSTPVPADPGRKLGGSRTGCLRCGRLPRQYPCHRSRRATPCVLPGAATDELNILYFIIFYFKIDLTGTDSLCLVCHGKTSSKWYVF